MIPTRARYITMAFAILLAIVMYIDRVCISQAAPFMRRDLGLTPVQMGWVFSIFGWAYALFEVPAGWLGDRIGPRRVLMRIVIWWSFFTAATGWVWNLPSLLVTRALFGMGEAGCFPNLTRVFTTWLPAKERERAQAFLWLATRWGGAFTPLLVAYVLTFVSWRRAFEIFGVLGVIWAIAFYRWYRDDPAHASGREQRRARAPAAEPGDGGRSRPHAVGANPLDAVGVAVVRAVRVPRLCLVVLRHLAADVSARRPRPGHDAGARCSRGCRCFSAGSAALVSAALVKPLRRRRAAWPGPAASSRSRGSSRPRRARSSSRASAIRRAR